MNADTDSSDDVQVLHAAAWIWDSYLVALAGIDWYNYAGAPNTTIA